MKILFALLLLGFISLATFGVHVWIMIVGWGVSPASWGVIVGGWVIMFILMVFAEVAKLVMKD